MRGVEFAKSTDRRVFILVERSGGHPDFDRLAETFIPYPGRELAPTSSLGDNPSVVRLVRTSGNHVDFTERAVFSVVGRWLAHWVIFLGGWTVHVDAPDRDPIKIRHRRRSDAEAYATRLAADLATHGPAILDNLHMR
jgi:hypothetical protein